MITIVLVLCLVGIKGRTEQEIMNSRVLVDIELKGLLVRTKTEVKFQNRGAEAIETYAFTVPNTHLQMFRCYNRKKKELKTQKILQDLPHFVKYGVFLHSIVGPNKQYTFECITVYLGEILTVFKARKIDEEQILNYNAGIKYFSMYHTLYTVSKILLNTDSVLNYSIIPTKTTRDSIIYETFETEPYTKTVSSVIYINNNPLLVVKNLERYIRISHFGKILIEDSVTLENVGPKLDGSYRNDLHPPTKAAASVLFTHLPSSAENIRYFDTIGNSSKSQIYDFTNFKTLVFKPRYPLLGGWKTYYMLAYDVPIYEYLFTIPDRSTILRIRPVDHIIADAVIEKVLVKIVLPDGARLDTFKLTEKHLNVLSKERECCNMCFLGRYVIVLNGSYLLDDYIEEIEVKYYLPGIFMFKTPLLLAFYIEVVFLCVIFLRK